MRTRIKIFRIASADESNTAIAAGTDTLGLVPPMPSVPGPVSDRTTADVTAFVPPPIATSLLTSDTTVDASAFPQTRAG